MSNQLIKETSQGFEKIFPKNYIQNLKDEDSGKALSDILKSFNMLFLNYTDNKSNTRKQVPVSLRHGGLWITYIIDKTIVTEWYNGTAIDDYSWGSDVNWREGSNMLVGDISISKQGTWIINGEDSGITIKGDKGDSPVIRIYDNKIQVSYDKGVTYEDLNNTPVYTKFRFNSQTNTYQVSYDLGANWQDISNEKVYHKFRYNSTTNTYQESIDFGKTWSNISAEKVYTKFRFNRSTNTYQISTDLGQNWTDVSSDKVYYQFRYNRETNTHQVSTDFGTTWTNVSEDKVFYQFRTNDNRLQVSTDLGTTWENCSEPIAAWFRWADVNGTGNVGKVQISRDQQNWSDLSPTITNNLYIKGYVDAIGNLPSNAAIGDIYMVGPTYDENDATHDYPHYRMWVKQSSGWVDNGEFTNAGPVSTSNIINGAVTIEKLDDRAIDDEPTTGSDNLVKSGGVANMYGYYKENLEYSYINVDNSDKQLEGLKRNGTKVIFTPLEVKGPINNVDIENLNSEVSGLKQEIIKEQSNFTDNDIFNALVYSFNCSSSFAEKYNAVEIQLNNVGPNNKYRCIFNFVHKNPDGTSDWNHFISLVNYANCSSIEESSFLITENLLGHTYKSTDYCLTFKHKFSNNITDVFTYTGPINYNTRFILPYIDNTLDFLSNITLAQDNADNSLRKEIINEKLKEAILNPSNAEAILNYNINDEMAKITSQMVRTDQIVVNDNICYQRRNGLDFIPFENHYSEIERSYFVTHTLWNTETNKWDFSNIKTAVQNAVNNGKRYIPRMFTSCSASRSPIINYTHANTKEHDGIPKGTIETCRICFPTWIADLMAADPNAQWISSNPSEQVGVWYWIPDFNVATVRAAFIQAIRAFGDFISNETVNVKGVDIPISTAFLYVEFNIMGTWGEGQMSPLDFNCDVDDLLEIWKEFLLAVPNNVVTTGGLISDSIKGINFTKKVHELSNNVGPYGFTIEHFGALDKKVNNGDYDIYVGKVFFSGEGGSLYKNPYFGWNCYLNTLEYLKRLKCGYVRVQNWTFEDAALNSVKNIHDTAFKNLQMLAFLGYRFVLTPTYCNWKDANVFRTYISIANIGSSKCWWTFYEAHVIVTKFINNIETIVNDTVLTNLLMENIEARDTSMIGMYSLGNANDTLFTVEADVSNVSPAESFNVYIKVVDKYGIASPLYFSNYGRIKEGVLNGCYKISSFVPGENYSSYYMAGFFKKNDSSSLTTGEVRRPQ